MTISLLRGWFFPTLVSVSILLSAGALGWRVRRWRTVLLPIAAVATVATVWTIRVLIDGNHSLQPSPPLRLFLWGGAAVFVVYAIVIGWRSASARQRLLAIPAVGLCLVSAAVATNYYYGYYPTVDSVFGEHYAHQVSIHDLQHSGYLGHSYRYRGSDDSGDGSTGTGAVSDGPGASLRAALTTVPSVTPALKLSHNVPQGVAPADAGRLVHIAIPGPVSGYKARRAWVYLPPVWFGPHRPQLPVVLMLAGTPGSTSDWIRAGQVLPIVDRWAKAHGGVAPIFVFADQNGSFMGDSECVDRPKEMVDTYLSVDVPAFVEKQFDSATSGRQWGVEGLSEGGTCAMTLALRHPDRFAAFADVSGEETPSLGGTAAADLRNLYGGSTVKQASYDPTSLMATHTYPGLGAWFGVGAQDGKYIGIAKDLAAKAKAAGASTQLDTPPGHHTFQCFAASFKLSLPWLAHELGQPGT